MAQTQGDQNFYIMEEGPAVNINRDNIHTMQKDLKKLSGVFIADQAKQQFAPQIKQTPPAQQSQQPYQSQINTAQPIPASGFNIKVNNASPSPAQTKPAPQAKKEDVVILEAYEIAAPVPEDGSQPQPNTSTPSNIPQTKTNAEQPKSSVDSTIAEEFLYHHFENKPQLSKPKVISEPVFPKKPSQEISAPTPIQQSKIASAKQEQFGQEILSKIKEVVAPVPELSEIDGEDVKKSKKIIEPIEIPGLQKTEQALEKMGQTIKEKAQEIISGSPKPAQDIQPKIVSETIAKAPPVAPAPATEIKIATPPPVITPTNKPQVASSVSAEIAEILAPKPETKPAPEKPTISEIKAPAPERPKDNVPRPTDAQAIAPPKENIQKTLVDLGKQKALIGAEKDLMMRGLELKATELKKSKELLLKSNQELLDKREDIEDTKLAVAMKAENDIEKELTTIIQKARHAKDVSEQEELEQKRNEKEQERQEAEKTRWKIEDEILQIIDEIENNKEKFDELVLAEEKLAEERAELSHREETIAFEETMLKSELELLGINEQQEILAGQYSELLPEKSLLGKALNEATLKKIKAEERLVSLELKEKSAQGLERRDIETQRQQAEQQRRDFAQGALKKLKDKERVEHEIDRIAKLMQNLNTKEKELKLKIKTLQDKIKQIRK